MRRHAGGLYGACPQHCVGLMGHGVQAEQQQLVWTFPACLSLLVPEYHEVTILHAATPGVTYDAHTETAA